MVTNVSSDVNWDNESTTQNDAENKEVLIDDVDNKIYMIKDYIPRKIRKRFLKPSYIVLSLVILVLIIIIGILSHHINDSAPQQNLSITSVPNSSTSLYESVHDVQHKVDETTSYSVLYEETTSLKSDGTPYYSTIDTTTEKENLFSTYEPNEEESDLQDEIILWEENEVWLFNINNQTLTSLYKSEHYKSEHVVKALDIASNKSWFLSIENMIVSLNAEIIFEESRVNPKSMAMDTINDNLYIVDESMGGLIVINTQSKYYTLLLMDLNAPSFITLDPAKGIMFIVNSESILKGNMDGTSLQPIFNSTHIGAITLDKKREKIYWIQYFENIMSSDYTGLNRKKILEDHSSISELMVLGNRLFWLRAVEGMNATLWSCSVEDDDCKDHSLHYTESLKNPKLFSGSNDEKPSTRQRCDHLSLAMPNGQVSCACNIGWQLVYNKSCHPYSEFALYTLGDTIRARSLDTSRTHSVEYIWPTPFKVDSLTHKSSIDFDYDSKNDNFYFSDDSNIYQMKIKAKNYSNQKVITMLDANRWINYLVYDWFTGNIYYISRAKQSYSYDYYIGVFNTRSASIKTNLFNSLTCHISYYTRGNCIFGLAISPSYGYIFFTSVAANYKVSVNRFRHIIKNDKVLNDVVEICDMHYDHNSGYALWFTVDFIKNRLYAIPDQNDIRIHDLNFNGTDRRDILPTAGIPGVQSASAHKQWIYLNGGTRVWKLHKETGELIEIMSIIGDRVDIGNFKIISQPEVKNNPCRNNNGGCEQFCFVGPTAICSCGDAFTLTSNGTCISE